MSNPYGPGIAVSREELDSQLRRLARAAGVRIIDGCWARMVERTGGAWKVHAASRLERREFQAELLILATGRGASDLLGRRPCKQLRSVAITASAVATALPRYAMYLEETEKGWWYAMPSLNEAAFVGYCPRDRHAVTGRAEPTFRQALAETTSIRRVLAGVSYLTVRGRSACVREYNNVFGEGWLAIGDAAFSPDPSSGQGLEFAVESGLCAARAASATTAAIGATLQELVTRQSTQHDRHGIWARVDG
jgi:flavin-dependent dehydrogenase